MTWSFSHCARRNAPFFFLVAFKCQTVHIVLQQWYAIKTDINSFFRIIIKKQAADKRFELRRIISTDTKQHVKSKTFLYAMKNK